MCGRLTFIYVLEQISGLSCVLSTRRLPLRLLSQSGSRWSSLLTGSGASSALKSALYPITLDDRIIRSIRSYEHETAAKPSPQTLASPYTSAATKAATQASAATGTEFMAETSLRPHK
jgi:hypothetical protein